MKKLISKLKNPKIFQRIVVICLVIAIVCGYFYFQGSRDRIKIDNSQISAPIINIIPSLPGKLTELDAVVGHTVTTGDVLAIVESEILRAKNNGLIVSAADQVGGNVDSMSPVVQMIKAEDLRVMGTIDENKGLKDIKIGQVASFAVDAFPGQTFWGYVDEISPSAKQTQAVFSISSERPTQQFNVFVRFDAGKYFLLKNGMSAKLVIYTKTN